MQRPVSQWCRKLDWCHVMSRPAPGHWWACWRETGTSSSGGGWCWLPPPPVKTFDQLLQKCCVQHIENRELSVLIVLSGPWPENLFLKICETCFLYRRTMFIQISSTRVSGVPYAATFIVNNTHLWHAFAGEKGAHQPANIVHVQVNISLIILGDCTPISVKERNNF